MTVDEIYANIGETIVQNLEETEWQQAILKIYMDVYPETVGYQLFYRTATNETMSKDIQYYPDNAAVEELFLLFLKGSSAWNEAEFILEPDGTFSMNFNWNAPEIFVAAKNKDWKKVCTLLQEGKNTRLLGSDGRTFTQYILEEKDVPEEVHELVKKSGEEDGK